MEFHVYETGETVRARAAADRHHHLEQREGAAGRLPAPLLLPLHPAFRTRETMARIVDVHYPGIKRRLVEEALRIFFEVREVPGLQEEALDLRASRLAEAPAVGGYRPRAAARARPPQAHPAAARRAPEERAGRAPVREARLHGKAGRAADAPAPVAAARQSRTGRRAFPISSGRLLRAAARRRRDGRISEGGAAFSRPRRSSRRPCARGRPTRRCGRSSKRLRTGSSRAYTAPRPGSS